MPVRATPNKNHLTNLAYRIHGLDGPFSCGGSVLPAKPIAITFADRVTLTARREPDGFRVSQLGESFAGRCRPAGFGLGRETKHDRNVRNGRHLPAKDDAFQIKNLDDALPKILKAIHKTLCPDDPSPPVAELYALNVYEPGGKFVVHKDTPRSADALGTLVVCLPLRFSGGALVLRHGPVEKFDWARAIDKQREPHRLHWAAFYGDVDHEIEEIYTGTRVTLTWNLRHDNGGGVTRSRRLSANERDLTRALEEALADPSFMAKGGTLGLPCTHLYAEVPGLAKLSSAITRTMAANLKGRDREFAMAALAAKLDLRLRPYLFESDVEERWRLSRLPTDKEASIFKRRQVTASTIEKTLPIEHHVEYIYDRGAFNEDVTWILPPPWRRGHREVAAELLGALEYSATDYFGNEGSDATFYVSASLLVDVPRARARGGA